jgi:hypothetical protein
MVTILVVLEPGDFTLYGVDSLEIVVPVASNEPSKNTVTFTIEAKKEGTSTINAMFRRRVSIRSPTPFGTRKSAIVSPRSPSGSRFSRGVAIVIE